MGPNKDLEDLGDLEDLEDFEIFRIFENLFVLGKFENFNKYFLFLLHIFMVLIHFCRLESPSTTPVAFSFSWVFFPKKKPGRGLI